MAGGGAMLTTHQYEIKACKITCTTGLAFQRAESEGFRQRKRNSLPLLPPQRRKYIAVLLKDGAQNRSVASSPRVAGCSALCPVSCNEGRPNGLRPPINMMQHAPRNVRANNSSPVSDTSAAARRPAVTQPLTQVPGTLSITRPINTCRQASPPKTLTTPRLHVSALETSLFGGCLDFQRPGTRHLFFPLHTLSLHLHLFFSLHLPFNAKPLTHLSRFLYAPCRQTRRPSLTCLFFPAPLSFFGELTNSLRG